MLFLLLFAVNVDVILTVENVVDNVDGDGKESGRALRLSTPLSSRRSTI